MAAPQRTLYNQVPSTSVVIPINHPSSPTRVALPPPDVDSLLVLNPSLGDLGSPLGGMGSPSGGIRLPLGGMGSPSNILGSPGPLPPSAPVRPSPHSQLVPLKLLSPEQQERFNELKEHLPPEDDPQYFTARSWISHLLRHDFCVLPDFVAQLGQNVHIIDTREEDEILSPTGYIRTANWYPGGNLSLIEADFPKNSLIALVASTDAESRRILKCLKKSGYAFAAVILGGMFTWKITGFKSSRDPVILEHKNDATSLKKLHVCDHSSHPEGDLMTKDHLSDHLRSGRNIQWIKMAAFMVHGRLSCIDGRDDGGVVAAPGGDMGEFITQLATAEQLLECNLTEEQVDELFQRRIDTFGRFYMHSDQSATNRLVEKLSDDINPRIREAVKQLPPDFAINHVLAKIPRDKMEQALDILTMPEHIGCGHLKFMLTDSEKYRVRHDLVKTALKCFFKTRWETGGGTAECDYVVLHGSHEECGVANITINREIQSYTKIPLISPSIQNKQIFVNHGQISQYLRHQHSQWFLEQGDILNFNKTSAAAYPALVDLLSEHHAQETVSLLAKDLPMYTLEFSDDSSSCVVHYNGIIGANPEPPKKLDNTPNNQNKSNNDNNQHEHGHGCSSGHTHHMNKE